MNMNMNMNEHEHEHEHGHENNNNVDDYDDSASSESDDESNATFGHDDGHDDDDHHHDHDHDSDSDSDSVRSDHERDEGQPRPQHHHQENQHQHVPNDNPEHDMRNDDDGTNLNHNQNHNHNPPSPSPTVGNRNGNGNGDGPSLNERRQQQHQQQQHDNPNDVNVRAMSQMYVIFSIFVALLAIVSPPGRVKHHHANMKSKGMGMGNGHEKGSTGMAGSRSGPGSHNNNQKTMSMYTMSSSPSASSSSSSSYGSASGSGNGYKPTSEASSSERPVLHGDVQSSFRRLLDEDFDTPSYPSSSSSFNRNDNQNQNRKHGIIGQFSSVEQVAKAAAAANLFQFKDKDRDKDKDKDMHHEDDNKGKNKNKNKNKSKDGYSSGGWFKLFRESKHPNAQSHSQSQLYSNRNYLEQELPPWLQWIEVFNPNKKHAKSSRNKEFKRASVGMRILRKFIDPSLLELVSLSSHSLSSSASASASASASTSGGTSTGTGTGDSASIGRKSRVATELVDKVLTSTPRIIAIINLLLAVTYLLQSVVANYFLGEASMRANEQAENEFGVGGVGDDAGLGAGVVPGTMIGMGGGSVGASASDRLHRSGRERLGGYLLFKLLLLTAVVEPDALDLLILLSWYTLLAFLRSLAYLAGITTAHTAASGQPPHPGVMKLLVTVFVCNISAAVTCTALFHGAGLGMVVLLTCDCGLLSLDVLTHVARYLQQVFDESHQKNIAILERRQLEIHQELRNEGTGTGLGEATAADTGIGGNFDYGDGDGDGEYSDSERYDDLRYLSRQIDHDTEIIEAMHANRLVILDNCAFILELFALAITMAHFLHVWVLHGVTFNLVDGVLALHLHSAVSAFGKKIEERKNLNRIARDLDKCFEDATDIELEKASTAGDVCCICLGTMSLGNVKKIGCGHLFHTQCLREVVERARSIEAARCPLCRASVLNGMPIPENENNGMTQGIFFGTIGNITAVHTPGITAPRRTDEATNENALNQANENREQSPIVQEQIVQERERALFRLSTEGLLPNWLPLPAFSFEVVRRFPNGVEPEMPSPEPTANAVDSNDTDIRNNNNREEVEVEENGENEAHNPEPSFWRRLLILAGAIPMSPEEEAAAHDQLVEMFPQYDRAVLLRELRDRGSAEAVVDSILGGEVAGIARNNIRARIRDQDLLRDGEELRAQEI